MNITRSLAVLVLFLGVWLVWLTLCYTGSAPVKGKKESGTGWKL
jgi:hypothetical protein